MKHFRLFPLILALFLGMLAATPALKAQYDWGLLGNSPQNGQKQDDVFLVNEQLGWSVNGSGRVFRTTDGGASWTQQLNQPGSYFRCIGFLDSLNGFLGNIGPNYFPGVSDFTPLYHTTDGGENWAPVPTAQITGPLPTGLCAIQVIDDQHVVAGGRVGGPALWMRSEDGGQTWKSSSLAVHIQMITDIYFSSPDVGYIFGGTNSNIQLSRARVIRTTDGGLTWNTVYTGQRTFELCWKASFPTSSTGYTTLLNYAPNYSGRYLAKTTDGGLNWEELSFVDNSQKAFGIGFVDANTGWVGTDNGGYETLDGGLSWTSRNIGGFVNKIRLLPNENNEWVGYAIGQRIYKMTSNVTSENSPVEEYENALGAHVFPNPTSQSLNINFHLPSAQAVEVFLFDTSGRRLAQIFNGKLAAGQQTYTYQADQLLPGMVQVVIKTTDYFQVLRISVLP
jgi:photosystem II stability/assembly factor-like uncharacterized protein